jgi:Protein of unknown function (DUF2281)
MNDKEQLIADIDMLPEPLVQEVLGFVEFLRAKLVGDSTELAVASESSLKKNWLRPEQEVAWQMMEAWNEFLRR